MASETDFLDMYRTLGLRPGCALPELKQAYRRHVARMHPDRKGGEPADPVGAARLQRLIAQYDAAMDFQREHGRLPGSTTRVRFAVPEAGVSAARAPITARRPAWRRSMWGMLLAVAALSVLGWDIALRSPESSSPASAAPATTNRATPLGLGAVTAPPVLSLGMSPEDVREIEGDPVSVQGDRWEYGPSWIRFEDDKVVDWYNSPLHSLGTIARTSAAQAASPPTDN